MQIVSSGANLYEVSKVNIQVWPKVNLTKIWCLFWLSVGLMKVRLKTKKKKKKKKQKKK